MKNNKSIFSWLSFFKKKPSHNITDTNVVLNHQNQCIDNPIGISNQKNNLFFKIKNFFFKNKINDIFFTQLEDKLLKFDFGAEVSRKIINNLIKKYKNRLLENEQDVYFELQNNLFSILNRNYCDKNFISHGIENNLYVILLIGVNGVGKTTVAAKLAYFYKILGKSVALVASDTFRAAAIEQINCWGDKLSIPVFYKSYGSDPSSVIFDSIEFAHDKKIDVLIIDTAGRLHNKVNLMQELQKNVRVIQKKISYAPNEIFLVLDARNGQNSLIQTELFSQKINNITGIILTKLDGTAKGGIIFAILEKFSIPIRYFCNGEKISDFYKFNAKDFIKSMFY
ncbi:signal recognition particle-docking protein FtsY [Buchnera aphidicola]|uniref:Signal recognition particle-docking protein FtsY n=1 Tax=Buchnera aphidicola (Sarucallis kahawaluokalani) TaxID=1241878 RepID=A0A4D6YCB7_9GAMM|nr:signal recognition particle-docking protein FtsY [Buchnera aphidicola]QCI25833.1 signal recognition particle-docking protein FtsY [Buchnera aphidicola (Sarucallis kahawaluokalani)]